MCYTVCVYLFAFKFNCQLYFLSPTEQWRRQVSVVMEAEGWRTWTTEHLPYTLHFAIVIALFQRYRFATDLSSQTCIVLCLFYFY